MINCTRRNDNRKKMKIWGQLWAFNSNFIMNFNFAYTDRHLVNIYSTLILNFEHLLLESPLAIHRHTANNVNVDVHPHYLNSIKYFYEYYVAGDGKINWMFLQDLRLLFFAPMGLKQKPEKWGGCWLRLGLARGPGTSQPTYYSRTKAQSFKGK